MRYLTYATNENEWNGIIFDSAREAYDYILSRSISEGKTISEYGVKPIEIQ